MTKTSVSVELESIERLADKVKSMVALLERSRVEQARPPRTTDVLVSEVDALNERLAEAEGADAEMTMLRSERDQIRTRCPRWLEQLEAIRSIRGG